ncbi:cobalamin biosynthesis protein [Protofrankia sp. BMG5.30]|uniref:cobalamin biosynthesis protein n=1 Tax=Protofrankia sp. BMG5.30 TaxID=1834514 RepID=UPI00097792A9|nr:cobalamin biosynthesis protein [Protofrankia sp. BMG5.30]ONH33179.1 adenosylcobinamide-phosphate synthase [Protofrankia sp. BMG5.30]
MSGWFRAVGLLAGAALDAALADPARGHPVAAFGTVANHTERLLYRDSRAAGLAYTCALAGGTVAVGALARSGVTRAGRRLGCPRAAPVALTTAATWTVLGGASLRRHGRHLGGELLRDDLIAARGRLPSLCGRDPAVLDRAGLSRAGVESLAENTSDAVVGPLLWGALGGVPGLLGYRAVNTLDALVGYRSTRHARFGWASARLDDLANLLPSRVAGLLACACAPIVGGSAVDAFWVMRRDGCSHPSPNAGQVEAAFAGALGLRLGGTLRYHHGVEHRPVMGYGRPAVPADLERAALLSASVSGCALVLSAGVAVATAAARSALGSARGSRHTSARASTWATARPRRRGRR